MAIRLERMDGGLFAGFGDINEEITDNNITQKLVDARLQVMKLKICFDTSKHFINNLTYDYNDTCLKLYEERVNDPVNQKIIKTKFPKHRDLAEQYLQRSKTIVESAKAILPTLTHYFMREFLYVYRLVGEMAYDPILEELIKFGFCVSYKFLCASRHYGCLVGFVWGFEGDKASAISSTSDIDENQYPWLTSFINYETRVNHIQLYPEPQYYEVVNPDDNILKWELYGSKIKTVQGEKLKPSLSGLTDYVNTPWAYASRSFLRYWQNSHPERCFKSEREAAEKRIQKVPLYSLKELSERIVNPMIQIGDVVLFKDQRFIIKGIYLYDDYFSHKVVIVKIASPKYHYETFDFVELRVLADIINKNKQVTILHTGNLCHLELELVENETKTEKLLKNRIGGVLTSLSGLPAEYKTGTTFRDKNRKYTIISADDTKDCTVYDVRDSKGNVYELPQTELQKILEPNRKVLQNTELNLIRR